MEQLKNLLILTESSNYSFQLHLSGPQHKPHFLYLNSNILNDIETRRNQGSLQEARLVHGPVVHGPPYLSLGGPWTTGPWTTLSLNRWFMDHFTNGISKHLGFHNHLIQSYGRLLRQDCKMTVSTTKNLQSYTTKSIGLQIRRIMLHARDFLFQHGILKSAMSCPGCSSIMNLVSCSSKKSSDLLIWRFSACSRFRNT